MKGGTYVSPYENMVAKRAVHSSFYHLPQIEYQGSFEIYYHGIYRNILYVPMQSYSS